jgi:DNA-binding NtrC family response regulator
MTHHNKNKTSAHNQKYRDVNVLIVNDHARLDRLLLSALAEIGARADLVNNIKSAKKLFENNPYSLVFINQNINLNPQTTPLPDKGFELIQYLLKQKSQLPIVLIAQKNLDNDRLIQTTRKAITAGCSEIITTESNPLKIKQILHDCLPNNNYAIPDKAVNQNKTLYHIVGSSDNLAQTVAMAKKMAPTSAPVLIIGESGTGKELFSHLIHHHSKRKNAPFIKINCAALTDSLLESEIFGHEKGAFTGAIESRKGCFEMANSGTLLLDEITETSTNFQAKILRVIEQQQFRRVGGINDVNLDVRIICTTNKNIQNEVKNGRLRPDLYYRISSLRLFTDPLRKRPADILDLTCHFVNLYAAQSNRIIKNIDPEVFRVFKEYAWPGNVRQLRNIIITSLVLGSGPVLNLPNTPWLFDEPQSCQDYNNTDSTTKPSFDIEQSKENFGGIPLVNIEKKAILDTLKKTDGNQTKAAKILGISDRTLRQRIRTYKEQNLQTVG